MKLFSCGDVVPGCSAQFSAPDEAAILSLVARHAEDDHGLTELSPELVARVRQHVRAA